MGSKLDNNTVIADLVRLMSQRGHGVSADGFTALSGGRTNLCWRVRAGGRDIVCKLFQPDRDSPLFPNRAIDENTALNWLAGRGLAPERIDHFEAPAGPVILSEYIRPVGVVAGTAGSGRLLAELHRTPAPPVGLRNLPGGSRAIAAQTRDILGKLAPAMRRDLAALEPTGAEVPPADPVFLHGDPVPANFIAGARGQRLIDWQCPALGDACEDLAIYLSPAMQIVYLGVRLSDAECRTFLDAYDDPAASRRLQRLAPWYHWRMAAYCAWKIARGETDYQPGLMAELAALGTCQASAVKA